VNKTQEKEQQSLKQTKWYPFFKDSDNIYINDLAKRAKRSSTHGAILQSKAVYNSGQGFTYTQNGEQVSEEDLDPKFSEYISEVNGDRDSLHWLFNKIGYDYIYSGNAYIEVKAGKEFTSLFYMDATKVRISDKTAFISAWWTDIKNAPENINQDDFPIAEVELWNGKIDTKQKHYIIHIKNDVPEFDYYGLPEHLQVLKWADIEYKVVQFNLSKLKNGFFPSVAMTLVGQPPQGYTAETYVAKVVEKFTDEGMNSKVFAQLVDSLDQEVKITEFTGASEGEMLQLSDTARDMIIAGHRWFPSLAGIATAGQLGSNQQIRNEYNIALKGVIVPQFQNPLLKVFNDLMLMLNFDYKLGILNVAPVGMEDRLNPQAVMTDDEQRDALGLEPLTDEQKVEMTEKRQAKLKEKEKKESK
jgi:hypothetical protein